MPRNFCHFHGAGRGGAGRGGDGVSPGQAGRASLILGMVLNQSSSDTSLYQYGWCLFLKEILSSLESSWYVTFAFPFFTCFFQNQLSVLRETFGARWRTEDGDRQKQWETNGECWSRKLQGAGGQTTGVVIKMRRRKKTWGPSLRKIVLK